MSEDKKEMHIDVMKKIIEIMKEMHRVHELNV